MKKCVLVNCFASSNEMRVEPIREVFDKRGYETIYISSDFHHTLKAYTELDQSIMPIHVRAYKKNLSVDRLLSHREFSGEVYKVLCDEKPDVIYIKFPPNTLVKAAYNYKKKHECVIILDLFDLWPESLPVPLKVKKLISPILRKWSNYRDKYVSCADMVLTECNMYREMLSDVLPYETYTLYLVKKDIHYHFNPAKPGEIRLCFLGGINNLTDIGLIGNVIQNLNSQYKVSLDIIGDGQNKDELIRVAQGNGAKTTLHGVIYDEEIKYTIMSNCDFGLNLVKPSVKIALSIKSIEYFRAGLGVINNIPFDTRKIIEERFAGINYSDTITIDLNKVDQMKKNSRKVYEDFFSMPVVKAYFDRYLSGILGK